MPLVAYSKDFKKQYNALDEAIQKAFDERLGRFMKDPKDPILQDKAAKHDWWGHRYFHVTGNFRAVYKIVDGVSYFVAVGSHPQLFKKY